MKLFPYFHYCDNPIILFFYYWNDAQLEEEKKKTSKFVDAGSTRNNWIEREGNL